MVKSILKEIIIMLLLCLAIVLILGVLFYEYIPSNKIVPNKVAYSTPENVKEEINEEVNEASFVNITYELDETEINVSKKNGDYKSGKQNPFENLVTEAQNNTITQNTTETSANNTSATSSKNTNVENSSNQQGYLPNNGTK